MKTYWTGHIRHALKYEFCQQQQQHVVHLVQLISLGKYHWNDEACTFFSRTAKSLHNEPIWIFPLPHAWNTLGTEKGRWELRSGVPWVVCLGDNVINNWLQASEIHTMSKANCSLIPEQRKQALLCCCGGTFAYVYAWIRFYSLLLMNSCKKCFPLYSNYSYVSA